MYNMKAKGTFETCGNFEKHSLAIAQFLRTSKS